MTVEKVRFPGHAGDALAARLERPPGRARACAVFAHCFTCGKDVVAASRIAAALTRRGYVVLRFDFTGLGSSEGDFANTNFSSNVDDLVAAAAWLEAHVQAPSLLVGHSLGGAAVLAAAARLPQVRAVATIGAPAEPAHVEKQFGARLDEIRRDGAVELQLGGRPFTIKKQFLDDLAAHPLRDTVAGLGRALLLLHAPLDTVVDVDNARQLYEAARHPKSFVSLDDADHLLRRREDAEYAADVIAAWAARYLPPASTGPADELPDGVVEVAETGEGLFTNTVRAGRHLQLADEPVDVGGKDLGPAPYDYLLAALGACTAMTLRLYARRKQLALERVRVRLSHQRVHARDCADCESDDGMISELHREIELVGDLSDAERSRLMEIADRCPVHRTLESEIRVRTRPAR